MFRPPFSAPNSPILTRARITRLSVRWLPMQSYDQFRESERLTWRIRYGVTALAMGAAAYLAYGQVPVATLAAVPAAYAAFFLAVRMVVLNQCRSHRWIYGMVVAETALASAAVALFGPLSPAVVLPLLLAPHFAHLLGRRGAYVGAAAGLVSQSAAYPLHPMPELGLIAALAISPVMLAGIVAFTAEERSRERRAREMDLDRHTSESGSGRLLQAVLKMSAKRGETEVARALAEGLRIATGYPTAVTLLNRSHDNVLVPLAVNAVDGGLNLDRITSEPVESETAAVRVARQGSAISLGRGSLSHEFLPDWALESGHRSGIAAPIVQGMDVLGVVYVLRDGPDAPGLKTIEQAEALTSFASRLLAGGTAQTVAGPPTALKELLTRNGRTAEPEKRLPIELPNMSLDPASEKLVIGGVGVSLSRTEFSMLYALAKSPGNVVPPSDLVDVCWDGEPAPNAGAVDTTIYRIRRKLARTPAGKSVIRTVRGEGYMLAEPDMAESQSTAA